jgi:type II secretory ATPase GspE/PulE/Tfp pilus assembly ATPase PilB-like protein
MTLKGLKIKLLEYNIRMTFQIDDEKARQKIADVKALEEEEALQKKAENLGMPYIIPYSNIVEGDALNLVPEEKAREAKLLAYKLDGKNLWLTVNDVQNETAIEIIKSLRAMGYNVSIGLSPIKDMLRAFEAYKNLSKATASNIGSVDITEEAFNQYVGMVKTIVDVKTILNDTMSKKGTALSHILEIILAGAIATKASDIHIEPEKDDARLRFRLDGMLYDVFSFDHKVFNLILSRIKLLSGLKLNVKNESQDGRLSINSGGESIEIRTSIVPGGYGESIVMRVLNPKSINVALETLGINEMLMPIIKDLINRPQGMILTTGPTGSGKTTTLYTFLKTVYTPELKILTIEDPIEYKLAGIVQTQIDSQKNYTFMEGLRAALRQDPDVIMVGEIRDGETARTAIDAALTGHLVFSTLHTNNAAGAFTRLIDLGVNPKVITSAVTASLAQRLLRKLCVHCKKETPVPNEDKETIEKIVERIKSKTTLDYKDTVWQAVGCKECNDTGYKGRIGVYEAILADSKIEEAIRLNPSERDIKKAAEPQKILDMEEDGVMKAINGTTSLDEVKRIVGFSNTN